MTQHRSHLLPHQTQNRPMPLSPGKPRQPTPRRAVHTRSGDRQRRGRRPPHRHQPPQQSRHLITTSTQRRGIHPQRHHRRLT
ncbi:hypothetical protein ACIQ8D_33600, partial [Streptomyces sp. NPDC096094]|uniref:hypothetical protein n=1 Tax=Streptomyces sp. NPDC096094 TaxID=3366073 RepID=UPI0038018F9A